MYIRPSNRPPGAELPLPRHDHVPSTALLECHGVWWKGMESGHRVYRKCRTDGTACICDWRSGKRVAWRTDVSFLCDRDKYLVVMHSRFSTPAHFAPMNHVVRSARSSLSPASLHPSLVPPVSSSSHLDEIVPVCGGNGDRNSLESDSEPPGPTVGPTCPSPNLACPTSINPIQPLSPNFGSLISYSNLILSAQPRSNPRPGCHAISPRLGRKS